MKILALELSSPRGSIAWRDGEGDQFARQFPNDRKDSGFFFEALRDCLERFGNPERIVVGLGPGSYAGTRIAISAAVGLQAAARCELIGLPSLCAMETATPAFIAIGDARRQTFFFARVRERQCVEGPELCTREELSARLRETFVPVFASEPLVGFEGVEMAYPSALVLAQIAKEGRSPGRPVLEPIYLRPPHITYPK